MRNDTGVTEGVEISMFYDPMIAKLCTWAPTRAQAIDAMSDALDGFVVDGIEHNIPFLAALMQHPRWREGRLSTGFIAEEYPGRLRAGRPDADEKAVLAAVATAVELLRRDRLDRLSRPSRAAFRRDCSATGSCRLGDDYLHGRSVTAMARPMPIESISIDGGKALDGRLGLAAGRAGLARHGRRTQRSPRRSGPCANGIRIAWQGHVGDARVHAAAVRAELDRLMPVKLPPDTSKFLLCPMPGLVVSIAVAEGQEVKAGETLAVVEAMKMENVLRAERDLTVAKINAKPGDSLAVDAVIMEFA